mmetsp:Transcript_19462/g.45286  ORF Transcript_19462/g.45286 Transcript_19462/m.45286 type:complete len:486 (-) Transcript_19462:156-1613(-)
MSDGHTTYTLSRRPSFSSSILRSDLLRQSQVFANCDSDFLDRVTELLKVELFAEGDVILEEGSVGDKVYLLYCGTVEVLVGDGKKVAELQAGTIFGEMALFGRSKRAATVKAMSFCDCRVIQHKAFNRVLQAFPRHKDIFRKLAAQRGAHLEEVRNGRWMWDKAMIKIHTVLSMRLPFARRSCRRKTKLQTVSEGMAVEGTEKEEDELQRLQTTSFESRFVSEGNDESTFSGSPRVVREASVSSSSTLAASNPFFSSKSDQQPDVAVPPSPAAFEEKNPSRHLNEVLVRKVPAVSSPRFRPRNQPPPVTAQSLQAQYGNREEEVVFLSPWSSPPAHQATAAEALPESRCEKPRESSSVSLCPRGGPVSASGRFQKRRHSPNPALGLQAAAEAKRPEVPGAANIVLLQACTQTSPSRQQGTRNAALQLARSSLQQGVWFFDGPLPKPTRPRRPGAHRQVRVQQCGGRLPPPTAPLLRPPRLVDDPL